MAFGVSTLGLKACSACFLPKACKLRLTEAESTLLQTSAGETYLKALRRVVHMQETGPPHTPPNV
eukprot:1458086-Amphidinium_carterae.1